MQKKLTKGSEKKLSGVCSGLAEYFDIDPTIARLGFAALTLFTGFVPGLVLYIVMAVVMPEKL